MNSDEYSDLLNRIAVGMGPTLQWFPEHVTPSTLALALVGMANTEGGTVILGVSPRAGELLGVRDPDGTTERVFQAALLAEPTLVLPIPRKVELHKPGMPGAVTLVSITIPAGLPNVYSLDGRYFARQGKQTTPMPARQLYKLLNQRGTVQFESRLVPEASISDLDEAKVIEYVRRIKSSDDVKMQAACEFLVRRGCLRRSGDDFQLTYAALLLFGR